MDRHNLLNIIHEDGDFLVINKPADLVCHPTKTDAYSSLVSRVRVYLGDEARPHLINRLDRETSGVTLVALTDDAAREIRRLWEGRLVTKQYLAIVHGHVGLDRGVIEAPLGKDHASRVAIKDCVRADGVPARTEYQVEQRFTYRAFSQSSPLPVTLLKVWLHTGRKHQIRIHLAHLGHPIIGDKLYGGDEDLYLALVERRLTPDQRQKLILPHHALHAAELSFPWRGTLVRFRAEPEPWFCDFLSGGQAGGNSCTDAGN